MSNKRQLKICLLSDNKKGHLIKSEGIIYALSLVTEIKISTFQVAWKIGFLRRILLITKILRDLLPTKLCLNNFKDLNYDLIVSAGGATEWINARLSKDLKVKNIFIGSLRHCKKEDFSFLAIDRYKNYPGYIEIPVVPNAINKDEIKSLGEEYYPDKSYKIFSVLIGGNGSGIKWTPKSFRPIFDKFLEMAKANQIKLIFLTSRRTPRFIERTIESCWKDSPEILKSPKESHPLELKNDRNHYLATLGVADNLFISEDSASMISEAISAGKKVFSFKPQGFDNGNHNEALLSQYSNANRLIRLLSVEEFTLNKDYKWNQLPENWQIDLGKNILNRI